MKITIEKLIIVFYFSHVVNSESTVPHFKNGGIVTVSKEYHKSTVTKIRLLSRIGSRENLTESPARNSRVREDSIIYFPSSSSAQNPGTDGDRCVTFYGRIGSCQPTYSCYQETPLLQTQLLAQCGHPEGVALICCPEDAVVKEKPQRPANQTTPVVVQPRPMPMPLENGTTDKIPTPIATIPKPTPAISTIQTPIPTDSHKTPIKNYPSTSIGTKDLEETCGFFNNSEKFDSWPWIVSVGHRTPNGSIRWSCLGSLITREHILTAAICLQQDPNVIAVGLPLLGPMSSLESQSIDIRPITHQMVHEKFVSPYLYDNVGMVQISPPIVNTPTLQPICFPFLASVLDIIHFKGQSAKTLGFQTPVRREIGLEFRQEEFRIMGNEQCARVFKAKSRETVDSFPRGIKPDNICGLRKDPTTICQAPGAPLVLYDEASSSHVLIGIASGDPTCSKFNRQLVTFTRMNSFSAWVRERVAFFPTPPPCYF